MNAVQRDDTYFGRSCACGMAFPILAGPASIRLDPRRADKLSKLLNVGTEKFTKLRGRGAYRLRTLSCETLAHLGTLDRLHEGSMHGAYDRLRRTRRRKHAVP